MALRLPNSPATDIIAMQAIKQVLVPNTQLRAGSSDGTGLSQAYINALFPLSLSSFPAVLLSSKDQVYAYRSRSTFTSLVDITVAYYNGWDAQPQTLDSVYAAVSADIERIRANIESNDNAVINGFVAIEAIRSIKVSPYYGEVVHTIPDIPLVVRTLTLRCVLPEYDA